MKRHLTYLASPYTDSRPNVREDRFRLVCKAAAHLFQRNALVFSPIAHCHPIATVGDLDTTFEIWQAFCMNMLERCDSLTVLALPSWNSSIGVRAEIAKALELGKAVKVMDPVTYKTREY